MSSIVIKVERVGKRYRISHQPPGGLRYQALRDVLADKTRSVARRLWAVVRGQSSEAGAQRSIEDFWALRNVSFEINQGEVVGIIGRNGAGKSTLLKILSRITEPTEGRVSIKGRVASLLEVGTGFHPELTGRENIFLNGAILGMSGSEIRSKFDEIVAFAEIEKFLDTPVKRYSSGMYVRLAFAVAAHLEPEILIVDEVLAVGDAEFQRKCLGKMESVARYQGRTVLFVSHNLQAIRDLAPRSILLNKGEILFGGDTKAVVEKYLGQDGGSDAWEYDTVNLPRRISGSGLVRVNKVWFTQCTSTLNFNDEFDLSLELKALEALSDVCFDITFFGLENKAVGTSFSLEGMSFRPGQTEKIRLRIPHPRLAPGRYYCDVAVLKANWLHNLGLHDVVQGILHFEVIPPTTAFGTSARWHPGWGDIVMSDMTTAKGQLESDVPLAAGERLSPLS